MTHTPPVPQGNQSPYPLREKPHLPATVAPPLGDPRVATTPPSRPVDALPTLIAIAAGAGLAAIAGGLFFALRGSRKPKKRKSGKRKASRPADA